MKIPLLQHNEAIGKLCKSGRKGKPHEEKVRIYGTGVGATAQYNISYVIIDDHIHSPTDYTPNKGEPVSFPNHKKNPNTQKK